MRLRLFSYICHYMRSADNFDLSSHNTFRMKVRCTRYVEYESVRELETIDWDSLPGPVKHIGEGSNLLFIGDFEGTVLHSRIDFIKYVDLGLEEVPVMVGSGVHWDRFVEETCRHGLWGAENLSLIPGEVGAAAVQNIGAYGVEIKDIISGVVCYDLKEKKKIKFSASECGYGYRDSMFKREEGRFIVTSVLFRLSRGYSPKLEYAGVRQALGLDEHFWPDNLTPETVREAIIGVRRRKLPDPEVIGSAGSFFKNPVVHALKFAEVIDIARNDFGAAVEIPHFVNPDGTVKIPAAWLIEKAGLKGACVGGASVFENQPLVIVNATGAALPEDVLKLERHIIGTVKKHFGIELSPEVEHI